MSEGPPERLFFVHIQKTAGTTFRSMLDAAFGASQVYPEIVESVERDPLDALARYTSIYRLLDDDRLHDYRAFVGHIPLAAAELLPFPVQKATVLRNPVDRAISMLSQVRRSSLGDRSEEPSLEEIYDDPEVNRVVIHEFQTRMLGLGRDDVVAAGPSVDPVADDLDPASDPRIELIRAMNRKLSFAAPSMFTHTSLDASVAARASRALGEIDVVGVSDDVQGFVDRFAERFGIVVGDPPVINLSPKTGQVGRAFRARIESDNPLDMALFEAAREQSSG